MKVKIKKLHEDAIIPEYQTPGSVGFDFHSIEDVNVYPGSTSLIKTGLSFEIPEGYELQIRPRSGMSLKTKIRVANSPGTIDCVPKGTLISTEKGEILVEDIFNSDSKYNIFSFNEEIQEIENDVVTDMWIVKNLDLLEIITDDGDKIKLPYDKKVFTENGWKLVNELDEKDKILKI